MFNRGLQAWGVVTDLASMTHVHFLDVPSANVSVYLDVSHDFLLVDLLPRRVATI